MSSKAKLHARRRAARFGDLDALLVEALKQQRRGEGAVKRLKGINQIIHEQYANPVNWIQRGVVMVIYFDDRTGQQTTVGMFQELIHRTGARKLTRVVNDSEAPLPSPVSEVIYNDPFLVRGKQIYEYVPPAQPDPLAQQAIRAYIQRTKEQPLGEFLGSKIDAAKLLNELRKMQLSREA